MALTKTDAARILGIDAMPAWRYSTLPYTLELERGLGLAIDYRFRFEPDELPEVQATKVYLQGADGGWTELPMTAISGTDWSEIEALISDEVVGEYEAAAMALSEDS